MRNAVVTGANSGLGLELTRKLLSDGWSVAAVMRRPMPDEPDFVAAKADGRLRTYRGDLADRRDRERVVAEVAAGEPKIDVLFNNAGISTGDFRESPQGVELNYEVNAVAPYAVLRGLIDNLSASGAGRVVGTSSSGVSYAKGFDPDALAKPTKPFKKLTGAYSDSKLALSLWTRAIGPQLASRNITIVTVDPGANKTPMTAGEGMPKALLLLAKLFFQPASKGAALLLDAATGPYKPGDFVVKGKAAVLPHENDAARVLEMVARDAGEAITARQAA